MKENIFRICMVSSLLIILIGLFAFSSFASTNTLSNKLHAWGFRRGQNNEQPDLDTGSLEVLKKFNGIAMGDSESKNVYLTFDCGYEAGYTENILKTLKENNITATFFITAHYLNTAEDLVMEMIKNGNDVGNHISVKPMYLKEKSYES